MIWADVDMDFSHISLTFGDGFDLFLDEALAVHAAATTTDAETSRAAGGPHLRRAQRGRLYHRHLI